MTTDFGTYSAMVDRNQGIVGASMASTAVPTTGQIVYPIPQWNPVVRDPLQAIHGMSFHISKIENGLLLVITEADGSKKMHFASEPSELFNVLLAVLVEKKLA